MSMASKWDYNLGGRKIEKQRYLQKRSHLVYLEVGDGLGDGAPEEADLDLLGLLYAADGDLEEHLVRHLQREREEK